jgi:hypothetical protein
MIHKKLAALAAGTVIGAALITAPVQAGFGGFGGMRGGGGFAGAHVGGFGGFRGGFAGHPAFIGRPAFVNHGFFPGHRFAFFPHRRFIAPFFGVGALYAASYSSCWTWVPSPYGWQRAWVCDSDYGYGYGYGY